MDTLSIGVDVGGSHISAALCEGQRVVKSVYRAHFDHAVDATLVAIIEAVRAVECAGVVAVGLGLPGNVDPVRGEVRYMPNFGWSQSVDVADRVRAATGHAAYVLNDARCAALAEARYGSGRDASAFVLLTLGTGIGGALVLEGQILSGVSYDAGEIGHHAIRSSDGVLCGCGRRGCFEAHASARGLVREHQAAGGTSLSALEVIDRLRIGESAALTAFAAYRRDLAIGLANVIAFFNPQTIALGGGLGAAGEIYDGLEALVDAHVLPPTRGRTRIVPATFGNDGGMIGAALYAREIHQQRRPAAPAVRSAAPLP